MLAPDNKQQLFSQLDNEFNIHLDINEQSSVWEVSISQSMETNPPLKEKIGDNPIAILQEYIEDRRKRGLKADYD